MPKRHTIIQASFILAVTAMVSRGMGFIREMIVAHTFGTGSSYDVYLIAISVPLALSNTMLFTIPNGFIPAYVRAKNQYGILKAQTLFTQVFLIVGTICLFAALSMMVFAPAFLKLYSPSLQGESRTLGIALLRLTACLTLLGGLFALMRSMMHAEKQFLLPAVAPLFMNGITILSILLFASSNQIYSLAWGLVAGYALQACIAMIAGRKDFFFARPDRERGRISPVLFGLGFVLLIEIMGQMVAVVDRAFFARIPSGALSALNFANTLCQVPIGVIGITIGTVLFPSVAEFAAEKKMSNIAEISANWLRHTVVLSIPLVILFLAYAHPLITLLFQRGAFDFASSNLTAEVFTILCFGIPAFIGHAVIVRVFYALKINRVLGMIAFLALAMKLILSYLFVNSMMHRGLAFATILSAWFLLIAMIWTLKIRVGCLQGKSFFITVAKVLLCALSAVGLSKWVFERLSGPLWMTVAVSWLLAGSLFLVLARILSVSEIQTVLKRLRR